MFSPFFVEACTINLSLDFKLSKIELMDCEFLSEGTKRVMSSSNLIFEAKNPSAPQAIKINRMKITFRF
jgi:hypothetical protein